MARLDELQGQYNSVLTRYLDLGRTLTRVPQGSQLSRFSAAGGGAAGGGTSTPAPGVGAVTVTPGSNGGVTLPGLGLAATQLPRLRESVAGMLPSLTSTVPSSVLAAAGGAAPSASALALETAGGAGGIAGAGLTAAQQAASAIDLFGQSGNLLVGGSGFNPLISAGLSFLPLLWGGTPLSPFSFLTGFGDTKPSARERHEQSALESRSRLLDALPAAQTPEDLASTLNRGAGRSLTGADVLNPATFEREFQGSLFDRSAGGSLANLNFAETARALRRVAPGSPAANAVMGMIPPDVRLTHLDFEQPFYAEGIHPEQAQRLAESRGVTVTTPEGGFSPSVPRPTNPLAPQALRNALAPFQTATGMTGFPTTQAVQAELDRLAEAETSLRRSHALYRPGMSEAQLNAALGMPETPAQYRYRMAQYGVEVP